MQRILQRLKSGEKRPKTAHKFGTFGGVFTPTVLTILGVIMYLRLGWVVGNAGMLGAMLIIVLANLVTICTGLSMSSITTNIKIGAGGAYSIISKSLGLEAGGSIGIPFYISQTLSAALYIIGFTEGWMRIFPHHTPLIVMVISWSALLLITYTSAHFAIKFQYLILVIIGASLVAVSLTPAVALSEAELIGKFEDAGFWQVFAIFFPAVTGIMAGANMSGDLKNPRQAIPVGTMSAIFMTLGIYLWLAYLLGSHFTTEELRNNQMIMVDGARWGPPVLAGILAATFSSALGSMLGAPRILQALAQQKTVFLNEILARKSSRGEPRNAIILTGSIILLSLVFGNLNALAALITMFFLITYGILNLVVFIQQSMKIISFRPSFRIPRIVPFVGALGCIFMMILINPFFSVIALIIIAVLYIWLERKGLQAEWGDIRGGMFLALAERASRIAAKFPRHQISWKPDLLVPIEDPKAWAGPLLFLRSITYPSGSVFAFTIKEGAEEETQEALNELLQPLEQQGVLVNSTVIEDSEFLHGAKLVIQTLRGGAFRPNTLFLTVGNDESRDNDIRDLLHHAGNQGLGAVLLRQHPRSAFGMQEDINLWLRDKSPNWHLAMLISLQLQLNWQGKINLVTVASDEKEVPRLQRFLERLSDQARLPLETEFHVLIGKFKEAVQKSPRADMNVFGLPDKVSLQFVRETTETTRSSCLFVRDSGWENALA